uniref:Bromo domain-containing protein n=1 Tax=Compsopogon caeruleus TaxID=31354 RepID=A0A7S1XFX4_9RHOD
MEEEERERYAKIALAKAAGLGDSRHSDGLTTGEVSRVEKDEHDDYDDDYDEENTKQEIQSGAAESYAGIIKVTNQTLVDSNRGLGRGLGNGAVPFIKLFFVSDRKIPKRRRRARTTHIEDPSDTVHPVMVADQSDEFDAPPSLRLMDPVEAFLNQERKPETSDENFPMRLDSHSLERGVSGSSEGDDDFEFAAKPLAPHRHAITPAHPSKQAEYLVSQLCWEDSIAWERPSDGEYSDLDSGVDLEPVKEPDSVPIVDADEDDIEWEDDDGGEPQAAEGEPNGSSKEKVEALDQVEKTENTPSNISSANPQEGVAESQEGGKDIQTIAQHGELDQDIPSPTSKDPKELVPDESLIEYVRARTPKNQDLLDGTWEDAVIWSGDESPSAEESLVRKRFSRLILDMNDHFLQLEPVSSTEMPGSEKDSAQGVPDDPFMISNDRFYQGTGPTHHRRSLKKAVLRGLQNSPPAEKANTTSILPTEEYLVNFHRPKLGKSISNAKGTMIPIRRRKLKKGSSQITAVVPKKRSDLSLAARDAYRVMILEYCVERTPVILPIRGMVSRLVTYSRCSSVSAAMKAASNAVGTPDADTVFMAPEDPPPLRAGDILQDQPPVTMISSHIFDAPCVVQPPNSSDFLVCRKGGKFYFREIHGLVSVGMVEPKIEVIAPNTERFKRYTKDRVTLWILRQFIKQKKEGAKRPSMKKNDVYDAFCRRRTYPETSLLKTLKELSTFEQGTYHMAEPAKGFAALEMELLRTITAEESAAFESMEAGWEALHQMGIRTFSHPTSQGNIAAAAEKTGDEAKAAVGTHIRKMLTKGPWHRSQIMIANQKAQKRDMAAALQLAKTANELIDDGGSSDAKINAMSTAEMYNVLNQYYKVPAKRIPSDFETRKKMLSDLIRKKPKGTGQPIRLPDVIDGIIKKHRTMAVTGRGGEKRDPGLVHEVVPLDVQILALRDGEVDALPVEDDGTSDPSKVVLPNSSWDPQAKSRKRRLSGVGTDDPDEEAELEALVKLSATSHDPKPMDGVSKVFKKVTNPDTGEEMRVEVTDPVEAAKLREKIAAKRASSKEAVRKDSENPLKISIGLQVIGVKREKKVKKTVVKEKKVRDTTPSTRGRGRGGTRGRGRKKVDTLRFKPCEISRKIEEEKEKRRRAQYGEDLDYLPRKKKSFNSSRRQKNGSIALNLALEEVEKAVREAKGYIAESMPKLRIKRLRRGEVLPLGISATNLANPKDTGLDFVNPVRVKEYTDLIKDQMYLTRIRQRCKECYYATADEFLSDMKLLVDNARSFHTSPEANWVVQHAELLYETAVEKIEEYRPEIDAAMAQIEKSKADGMSEAGTEPVNYSNSGTPLMSSPQAFSPMPAPSPSFQDDLDVMDPDRDLDEMEPLEVDLP